MLNHHAHLTPLSEIKATIEFQLSLTKDQISLNYSIDQSLGSKFIKNFSSNNLTLSNSMTSTPRRDYLLLKNCFEFFIKAKDSPSYLEFNFSPKGEWNVFHFSSYRKNKEIYKALELSFFEHKVQNNKIHYNYKLNGSTFQNFEHYHSTAIIYDGKKPNYFHELGHISLKPDFHLFPKDM